MAESKEMDILRNTGDAAADELMALLFEKYQHKMGAMLMPILHNFNKTDYNTLDENIAVFFKENSTLPEWYNIKETIRATDYYTRNQQAIGVVLGCYSLPYCYLGEDGARVLGFSGRIKKDTYNRLKETGQYLRKVMNYDHWESGVVFEIILKVRLLHAFWRFMVLKSDKWDPSWGVPINQEDLLGTNLAFSLIVLRGLKKLGHSVDQAYEKAYLHHWAVIGHILGLCPDLLVFNIKDAIKMDKIIAQRQFKTSEIGQELTHSLMNAYAEATGSKLASEFFKSQSRFLLGEKYADWLGIPESSFPLSVLHAFNKTSSFMSNIYA
jgi:hypothetical protein